MQTPSKLRMLPWYAGISLLMPVLSLVGAAMPDGLLLLTWPGSLVLMSLGEASRNSDIIYAWIVSVFSNVGLYCVIGVFITWFWDSASRSS